MKRLVVLLIAVCALAHTASTAPEGFVSVEVVGASVAAGDSTSVAIVCVVRPGYHVQANPASSEFLIPLEVSLSPADGLVSWRAIYPPAATFDVGGEALLTYHDSVSVAVTIHVSPDAAEGKLTIPASLRYQACDNRRCFAPVDKAFEIRLTVR